MIFFMAPFSEKMFAYDTQNKVKKYQEKKVDDIGQHV